MRKPNQASRCVLLSLRFASSWRSPICADCFVSVSCLAALARASFCAAPAAAACSSLRLSLSSSVLRSAIF